MDNRALTKTGEALVVDEAPAPVATPFLRWFLWGALATVPFHAVIIWSLS